MCKRVCIFSALASYRSELRVGALSYFGLSAGLPRMEKEQICRPPLPPPPV